MHKGGWVAEWLACWTRIVSCVLGGRGLLAVGEQLAVRGGALPLLVRPPLDARRGPLPLRRRRQPAGGGRCRPGGLGHPRRTRGRSAGGLPGRQLRRRGGNATTTSRPSGLRTN